MAYKLLIENNQTIPAVLWQEDTVEGFTDYTSNMLKWDEFAVMFIDLSIIQKYIGGLVIAIAGQDFSNWNNLTADQKTVACRWFIAPYSLRVPGVVTEAEDKQRWDELVPELEGSVATFIDGRARIYQEMWQVTSDYVRRDVLSRDNSKQLYKDIEHYANWFIYSAAEDLIWWLNNTVGSPYENDGFAQKSYFNADIRDDVTDIWNGNFTLN